MTDYISREALLKMIGTMPSSPITDREERLIRAFISTVKNFPAADVRPVVLCGVCELHGHCYTEDVFALVRLAEENRFCAVGKVKTNGVKREES